MKEVKAFSERKEELVRTADRLFLEKGYDKCTVNDIINTVGIAKGTFYHYFKSKEEVLDAVVESYISILALRIDIIETKQLTSIDKLQAVMLSMNMKDEVEQHRLEALHMSDNVLYHQKLMMETLDFMTPVVRTIIELGNHESVWQCEFPHETSRIFLAAALSVTDEAVTQSEDEQQRLLYVLVEMLEKMLNVKPGSFLNKMA